jgi:hypothetical protein
MSHLKPFNTNSNDALIAELLQLRGDRLPNSVIGKRNCGLPTFDDCAGVVPGSTTLPLQPKALRPIMTKRLGILSQGTAYEVDWEEARRILEDPKRYANVPKAELHRSKCTLNKEQTQHMLDIDFWELLTPAEVEEIMGICRVFTRDELWKDPARARVITWAWSVNQDLGMRVAFDLFNQSQVRHLVHEATHGACIDGKNCFSMFCYSLQVSMWHVVRTPLGWARVKRCGMGARPSCFVANTALGVLADGSICKWKAYIDNLALLGAPADLIADLIRIRERSEFCHYTGSQQTRSVGHHPL